VEASSEIKATNAGAWNAGC